MYHITPIPDHFQLPQLVPTLLPQFAPLRTLSYLSALQCMPSWLMTLPWASFCLPVLPWMPLRHLDPLWVLLTLATLLRISLPPLAVWSTLLPS